MMTSHRSSLRVAVLLLLVGAAAACGDTTEPRRYPYGIVLLENRGTSPDFRIRPIAYFFREQELILPSSQITADSCGLFAYTPGTGSDLISGGLSFLDAGPQVTMVDPAGGQTVLPKQTQSTGAVVYTTTDVAGVAYEPGDSLQFQVPGISDGFPALTIKARTAEEFTLGPVAVPTAGDQNVTVTWTPAGGANAKMILSLRFASTGSGALNGQVGCSLVDDGSHIIPSVLLGGWRSSYNDQRQAAAQRLRTRLAEIDDASLLVFSTFTVVNDVPVP